MKIILIILAMIFITTPIPVVDSFSSDSCENQIIQESPVSQEELEKAVSAIGCRKGLPEAKITQIKHTIGGNPDQDSGRCAWGESNWDTKAIGDDGNSFGLVQINLGAHPDITKEQAMDPIFSIEFITDEFIKGNEWKWTCWQKLYDRNINVRKVASIIGNYGGSCVEFVQRFVGLLDDCENENCYDLPFKGDAINIEPNSESAEIGSVVLLDDGDLGHVALLVDIIDGDYLVVDSNYEGDEKIRMRVIEMNNPKNILQKNKIRGYYKFNE